MHPGPSNVVHLPRQFERNGVPIDAWTTWCSSGFVPSIKTKLSDVTCCECLRLVSAIIGSTDHVLHVRFSRTYALCGRDGPSVPTKDGSNCPTCLLILLERQGVHPVQAPVPMDFLRKKAPWNF